MDGTSNESFLPPGRSRASVACNNCRQQRRKCVLKTGEESCSCCTQSGLTCIFDEHDERKRHVQYLPESVVPERSVSFASRYFLATNGAYTHRPKSTSYIESLLSHIELLESRLIEVEGGRPPQEETSTVHFNPFGRENSPAHQHEPLEGPGNDAVPVFWGNGDSQPSATVSDNPAEAAMVDLSNVSGPGTAASPSNRSGSFLRADSNTLQDITARQRLTLPGVSDIITALRGGPVSWATSGQSTACRIQLGPLSGLQQYVNQLSACQRTGPAAWSLHKRTDRMIEELDRQTHDYLMDLFWSAYNNVFNLVDRDLFYKDKDSAGPHYSGFLHLCSLAMGFRFADKDRVDMQRLDLGNWHCTFHQGAKYLFETELESPSGLSTIQGLLILSDLECAVGEDRLGWMYCGIACRLSMEMGLTVENTLQELSDHEIRVRKNILKCCLIFDQAWSLYAGHPTVLKNTDLSPVHSMRSREPLDPGQYSPSGSPKTSRGELHDAVSRLMDLGSRVVDFVVSSSSARDHGGHTTRLLTLTIFNGELNAWSQRLPPGLRWSNENAQTAPVLYFLMHQQFYAIFVQLYRLFATYEKDSAIDGAAQQSGFASMDALKLFAHGVCLTNAIHLVDVLLRHRDRFDLHPSSIFALQSAGLAGITLILGVSSIADAQQRSTTLQKIQSLLDLLKEWSQHYRPAQSMADVIQRLLY